MLLSLRGVLIALHVVVLAVMICGGAMRLGCALVMIGGFRMGLTGHGTLSLSGNSGLSLAAPIVFAGRAFVVFSELNGSSGRFDR